MSRKASKTRSATLVDAHVGKRVREKRTKLDMSQTALAQACGITFQQVQKYENGANRVSASRLWQFAAIFGVSVDYFFEGLTPVRLTKEQRASMEDGSRKPVDNTNVIDKETVKIARLIAEIRDPTLKKRLQSMVTVLAAN